MIPKDLRHGRRQSFGITSGRAGRRPGAGQVAACMCPELTLGSVISSMSFPMSALVSW